MIWGYVLALFTALIVIRFTKAESEMRNCQLSGYVYAALFLASLFLHSHMQGQIVSIFIIISYFTLCAGFESTDTAIHSFLSFLFLGVAALMFPPVKWMIPAYWIGMMILRSLNVKSFIASVLGIVLPWFWVVSLKAIGLETYGLDDSFSFAMQIGDYSTMTRYKWIMAIVITLLFVYGSGVFSRVTFFAKYKTRTVYYVINIFSCFTILYMLISPAGFMVWYPLAILNVSVVLSRMLDKRL